MGEEMDVDVTEMEYGDINISFVPHTNTITESGKSHFSLPSHAAAELIDNAIQACKDEKARNVKLSLFYNKEKEGTGYLMVADNGCGMDPSTLQQLMVMGLDRKTRDKVETGDTAISKFGVGAKQAGFYLGERMRFVTRPKVPEDPQAAGLVNELVISADDLRNQYNTEQKASEMGRSSSSSSSSSSSAAVGVAAASAYTSVIHRRDSKSGRDEHVPDDERRLTGLMDAIAQHEEDHAHFTIVVIKLHTWITRDLVDKKRYLQMADDLAQIYHFHLHPKHRPGKINEVDHLKNAVTGAMRCVLRVAILDGTASFLFLNSDIFPPHRVLGFSATNSRRTRSSGTSPSRWSTGSSAAMRSGGATCVTLASKRRPPSRSASTPRWVCSASRWRFRTPGRPSPATRRTNG